MPIIKTTNNFDEVKKSVIDALEAEAQRKSAAINNIILNPRYQPGGPGMFQQSNLRNESYAFDQHRRAVNSAITIDELINCVKDLLKGKNEMVMLRTQTGAVLTGTERMEHISYGCDALLNELIKDLQEIGAQHEPVDETENNSRLNLF